MGDTRSWVPRSYVILWALATVNLMRLVPVESDAKLDVVPVDYTAKAITDLLFVKRNYSVYHISAGTESVTCPCEIVSALSASFKERPDFKFVDISMIAQMKKWAKGNLNPQSPLNEYSDYLDYWDNIFESKGMLRILFAGLEPYMKFTNLGQIFDNSRLLQDTNMGHSESASEYLKRSVKYLENIDVFEGAIDP
jgi:hypothetical protein